MIQETSIKNRASRVLHGQNLTVKQQYRNKVSEITIRKIQISAKP